MKWLKEEEKNVEAMPEKEQVQVSRDLIGDRMKWLEEEKKKQKRCPRKSNCRLVETWSEIE
jgi:hypothetical protein